MGRLSAAKILLKHGANVNPKESNGRTILMAATSSSGTSLELVQLLLKHGAEVNAQDKAGETALTIGSQTDQPEIAKMLLQHKADIHARDRREGKTALLNASSKGHAETVRILLENGADPNDRYLFAEQQRNIIFVPVYPGLSSESATAPKKVRVHRMTALIVAAQGGFLDTAKILLKRGLM